jgi:hypothetical protein
MTPEQAIKMNLDAKAEVERLLALVLANTPKSKNAKPRAEQLRLQKALDNFKAAVKAAGGTC